MKNPNLNLNFNLNLSGRLWLYLGVCGACLVGMAYWFWSQEYVAYSDEAKELTSQTTKKRAQLRQILAQKQRLDDLELEIEQANTEFIRLKEMFPDEEVIPKRLIDLTAVTRRSLTIPTKFLPLETQEKEFYMENHYAITLSTSFHGLGQLFSEIANFRYPTAISKMTIERAPDVEKIVETARDHGDIPKTITAGFTLTTFTSKR